MKHFLSEGLGPNLRMAWQRHLTVPLSGEGAMLGVNDYIQKELEIVSR